MSANSTDINAGNGNNLDVDSLSVGDQTNGPKSKRKRKEKQKDSNAWTWSMDKNILLLEKRIELEESFRNAYHTKNAWVKLIKSLNWQIGHEVVSTKFNNLIKYYSKAKKPSTGTEGCLERDKAKAKLIELVHFFIKDSHKHHPPIVHDTADPQLTDENENERGGNGIEQDVVNVSQETSNPLREQDEEPDDLAWYLQGLDEDSESEAPQTINIPSPSQSFISLSRPSSVNSNASAFNFSTPSPTPSPAPSSTPSSTQSSTQSSTGSSNSDESRRKRKRNLTYKQIMLESQENLKDLTSQWKELKDRTCRFFDFFEANYKNPNESSTSNLEDYNEETQ